MTFDIDNPHELNRFAKTLASLQVHGVAFKITRNGDTVTIDIIS